MKLALDLARIVKGTTSPNPAVGAVLIRQEQIIGLGATQPAGGDHAEIIALKKAGARACKATLYVTLEPCCHTGRTGPCTQAIINAKVRRVVCAVRDPNPLVRGKGLKHLRQAGIQTAVGPFSAEASLLNRDFFKYINTGIPFVTLKLAMTLDGRIADNNGHSRWITGPDMRRWVHRLRTQHDAIMVGRGTVQADDPLLTVRRVRGRNPLRVVLDPDISLSNRCRLARTAARISTLIFHSVSDPLEAQKRAWPQAQFVYVGGGKCLPLSRILRELGRREITSVLVEGGSALASSFLRERLVDQFCLCFGPILLGQGLEAFRQSRIRTLEQAIRLKNVDVQTLGNDILVSGHAQYRKK